MNKIEITLTKTDKGTVKQKATISGQWKMYEVVGLLYMLIETFAKESRKKAKVEAHGGVSLSELP